jgi:predicted dehydrogenase
MSKIHRSIEKLLIIGLGSIGKRHLRIVKQLFPSVKIIALRHKQCDSMDLESFGLYACVNNIEKAIQLKPDAAIISNPSSMRLEIMNTLANVGVHILSEKPISSKTDGIQDLINSCIDSGIVLMTGYNLRFLPSLLKFRQQIQIGKIGKILSFNAEVGQNLLDWRPNIDYKKTVSSQKKLGGGVLLEMSHELDYIAWIFGKVEWVKSHISKQSNLEIDVEDNANIIFGIKHVDDYNIVGQLNMNFFQHNISRNCKVVGEKGTLVWDGVKGKVKFYGENSNSWRTIFSSLPDRDFTYQEEIKNFIHSIEYNEKPYITGTDGLKTLQLIDAIRKSSAKNNVVYL